LDWRETTVIVVESISSGQSGIGFTYGSAAAAELIKSTFIPALIDGSALSPRRHSEDLSRGIRNSGSSGISALAISAVDISLWDLKAKLLGCSLGDLLGAVRDKVPLYGSGGFTTYSEAELCEQLEGWADAGFRHVKMKLSGDRTKDCSRVRAARRAIGDDVDLFVDANGAYDRQSALAQAHRFQDWNVAWFEEPVTSDDTDGLAWLCQRVPPGMNVAAGEYGFGLRDFRQLIEAEAVHVLQADATRCGGITGFLKVAALAETACLFLSAHCAPQIHAHLAAALPRVLHVEYFHDHARADKQLFDGVLQPESGMLIPDRTRLGMGLTLKNR
jgi:L-alanine-DL-glutamate epimerase-like enolase superfamily enzyme